LGLLHAGPFACSRCRWNQGHAPFDSWPNHCSEEGKKMVRNPLREKFLYLVTLLRGGLHAKSGSFTAEAHPSIQPTLGLEPRIKHVLIELLRPIRRHPHRSSSLLLVACCRVFLPGVPWGTGVQWINIAAESKMGAKSNGGYKEVQWGL